ncbi:hypothetical protein DSLASN_06450 [Desulfoluna limicola]|uniref:RING-type E3 ubiquitin transferase n=2 Tax=Desulfoluna limicola TaxID=2810562 RepID=A0ABM7PCU5_9BACT|nr:hypothetical protein DSLASN_06450 [Desulfoluna limicola]
MAMVVCVGAVFFMLGLLLYGYYAWMKRVNALRSRLQRAHVQASVINYDEGDLGDLPDPVKRYFSAVLRDGQPLVSHVNITHSGTFNTGGEKDRWVPFRSKQCVVTRRPGFVWDARVRIAPGMVVSVYDAYVAGKGALSAKILGLVSVMEQPSTPELAQGELMRFFAECTWYPTALLPSQGVRWEPINASQARAAITDEGREVVLVFTFDKQGLMASVYSDGRYRDIDGEQVATPWEGRFWNYQWRHGMMVPLEGEVSWLLPEGPCPYWRGRIQKIEYVFHSHPVVHR